LTFVRVAETSEIPLGQMKVVKLAEKEVLITNVNNVFTLSIGSMSAGSSHTLSITFNWNFKSPSSLDITNAWSAVCSFKYGTTKTPYTGVIHVN